MSFIITNPHGDVLSSVSHRATWHTRSYAEGSDYHHAIVFPSRESAEDACAARGEGAVVERLPADL